MKEYKVNDKAFFSLLSDPIFGASNATPTGQACSPENRQKLADLFNHAHSNRKTTFIVLDKLPGLLIRHGQDSDIGNVTQITLDIAFDGLMRSFEASFTQESGDDKLTAENMIALVLHEPVHCLRAINVIVQNQTYGFSMTDRQMQCFKDASDIIGDIYYHQMHAFTKKQLPSENIFHAAERHYRMAGLNHKADALSAEEERIRRDIPDDSTPITKQEYHERMESCHRRLKTFVEEYRNLVLLDQDIDAAAPRVEAILKVSAPPQPI